MALPASPSFPLLLEKDAPVLYSSHNAAVGSNELIFETVFSIQVVAARPQKAMDKT